MADNVGFAQNSNRTPDSDIDVATDDIGGVHHQRIKVQFGADGSATDVSSAAPLPVIAGANDGVDIGDVDVASLPGTVEADITAIKTATELIDNAISGSEMQVDVVTSALPTGAATETTLDAVKTAVELIDNAISGSEMQVDIVADGAGLATAANQQAAATTPAIYNVSMVSADTEYSQALPANTKRFSVQCLTDFDVRFAFETGKVATPTAPYALIRAGMNYFEDRVNLASTTVYVACPSAGKVAEIIAWT